MWALGGDVVGIDRFGASAPGKIVMKELGFTRGECGGEGEEAGEVAE
jgi:transketolase